MGQTLEDILTAFIVEEFLYGDGTVSVDEDLCAAGILESMSFLRLLAFLDDRFGVTVAVEDITLDRFDTVRKTADYLRAHGGMAK